MLCVLCSLLFVSIHTHSPQHIAQSPHRVAAYTLYIAHSITRTAAAAAATAACAMMLSVLCCCWRQQHCDAELGIWCAGWGGGRRCWRWTGAIRSARRGGRRTCGTKPIFTLGVRFDGVDDDCDDDDNDNDGRRHSTRATASPCPSIHTIPAGGMSMALRCCVPCVYMCASVCVCVWVVPTVIAHTRTLEPHKHTHTHTLSNAVCAWRVRIRPRVRSGGVLRVIWGVGCVEWRRMDVAGAAGRGGLGLGQD